MKKTSILIIAVLIIFFNFNTSFCEELNWDEILKAKNLYENALCEFTRYHLNLDKNHLANSITSFKDAISIDPNYSKAYYGLISALEEFEAGSSEEVSESLRELLEGMFDPFVLGSEAALEIAAIEVLGVCMERIRLLESALNYGKKIKKPLSVTVYKKMYCPCGGEYQIKDGKERVKISCSIHTNPTGGQYKNEDYSKTYTRYKTKAFHYYLAGLKELKDSIKTHDSGKATKNKKAASHLFLKAIKDNPKLIEAYIAYLHIASYGKFTPSELDSFVKKFRLLIKDERLKRYGRLAAGDLLDLNYTGQCFMTQIMIKSGIEMYLLNIGKHDVKNLNFKTLLQKGYLKQYPVCPSNGEFKIDKTGKEIRVYCTKHKSFQ